MADHVILVPPPADANGRDPEGLTPLMIAAGFGQPEIVADLLAAGADVLAVEPRMGASALGKAAQSGSADIIGLLLDHGAFIDGQSPTLGNTPLMDAVLHKREEAVRLLLARGAKTTIANHSGKTALGFARSDGLHAIARLIEASDQADAARVRDQALMAAVKAGDIDEVERLVAAGAVMDERSPMLGGDDDDFTPLGLAARDGHVWIVRTLLGAGADPRLVNGVMGGTPAHEAAYFGHAEVIRVLTDKGERSGAPTLEIDAQGRYNGFTALHDAVWHGHLEAARALVEAGARLDLTTHAGLTPRKLALLYRYDELARFLAEAEQDVSLGTSR